MSGTPLATIAVGVIVERAKATSQWIDYIWRPTTVLAGQPDTAAWTQLADDGERATYYAGSATVELHRTETANYRDNLASGSPALWVVLYRTGAEPPYALYLVTADPAEGEAMTEAGSNIVEPVPMPDNVRDAIAAFVAEHHVEKVFVKRKRDRAPPEPLGRRPPSVRKDER
jgi:Protein of unknown function (DUF3305)